MTPRTTRVGILSIGNEILDGLVLDTNSNWIQRRLASIGARVDRLVSVRDDLDEIGIGLSFVRQTCDVIVTSGGLGPTHDDMTLAAIARALHRKLVEDSQAEMIVRRQYKMLHERNIVDSPAYTPSRRKMARIPEGGLALNNTVGGAPGVELEDNGTTIFCLPGVPSELKFIFDDSVVPWLTTRLGASKYVETVVEFHIGDESVFAPVIESAMTKVKGVYIKSMPKTYGTSDSLQVWVSAHGKNKKDADALVSRAVKQLETDSGLSAKVSEY